MKFPLFFSFSLSLAFSVQAQQTVPAENTPTKIVVAPYLRLGLGGGLVHNGALGFTGSSQQESGKVRYNSSPVSFTSGASLSVAAGCTFNKRLGIDVAVAMYPGAQSYVFMENTSGVSSMNYPYFSNNAITTHIKAPVFILPSVVVRTGWVKADPYMRLGISLLLQNSFNVAGADTLRYNWATIGVRYTDKYDMRTTVGLNAVGGCAFRLSGYWQLWGEVGVLSHNPWLSSRETIAYSENGLDKLNSLTKTDRYTRFGNSTYNEPTNNEYSWGVTQQLPYSNINFAVGFSYVFH
jgi:hypothetical protein